MPRLRDDFKLSSEDEQEDAEEQGSEQQYDSDDSVDRPSPSLYHKERAEQDRENYNWRRRTWLGGRHVSLLTLIRQYANFGPAQIRFTRHGLVHLQHRKIC